MTRTNRKKPNSPPDSDRSWADNTELVGLVFQLTPLGEYTLLPQYTTALHAWFLDQVRQFNPELSAYLHDGQSEKPFTISGLLGEIPISGKQLKLSPNQTYQWYVTGLSKPVIDWMRVWLTKLPEAIQLRQALLKIEAVEIAYPPTSYQQLLESSCSNQITLSFITPTSFRRKGHHFPLPLPNNLFHSYLRRWNDFSGLAVEQEPFLEWIDETVIIYRHQLESVKVAAGKKGMVTGFIGAIELNLSSSPSHPPEYVQLYQALGTLAPYSGTGHKTTFGLGQTRLGWLASMSGIAVLSLQQQLAERIEELTAILMSQQKRQGGNRAAEVCQLRATILARRELGESLSAIATDLGIPYQTVKTYVKLARRALGS